jgi:hypothetical protein
MQKYYIFLNLGPAAGPAQAHTTVLQLPIIETRAEVLLGLARADDYTYIKTAVDKLKGEGVTWIFIDEVSMISSNVWSVIRDIKIYMVLSLFYLVIFTNYQVLKLIIMI